MHGFAGDTLASALLANGVTTVATSFKYGRPRGVVGHGAEEPNAIVQLGQGGESVPNLRATQVELYDGLEAEVCSRSMAQRLVGRLGRFMPAGFYYKTFMGAPQRWTAGIAGPTALWTASEHILRRATGLGYAPAGDDPDTYDRFNRHCDVLVVGAGPAGLAAALEAARSGARILIADEQAEFGGSLLDGSFSIAGQDASNWVADAVAELAACADVDLLPGARSLATTTTTSSPSSSAARTTSASFPRTAPVSACTGSAPGRSCWPRAPSSVPWCSPTTTGPAFSWHRRSRAT